MVAVVGTCDDPSMVSTFLDPRQTVINHPEWDRDSQLLQ